MSLHLKKMSAAKQFYDQPAYLSWRMLPLHLNICCVLSTDHYSNSKAYLDYIYFLLSQMEANKQVLLSARQI